MNNNISKHRISNSLNIYNILLVIELILQHTFPDIDICMNQFYLILKISLLYPFNHKTKNKLRSIIKIYFLKQFMVNNFSKLIT